MKRIDDTDQMIERKMQESKSLQAQLMQHVKTIALHRKNNPSKVKICFNRQSPDYLYAREYETNSPEILTKMLLDGCRAVDKMNRRFTTYTFKQLIFEARGIEHQMPRYIELYKPIPAPDIEIFLLQIPFPSIDVHDSNARLLTLGTLEKDIWTIPKEKLIEMYETMKTQANSFVNEVYTFYKYGDHDINN